MLYVVLDVDRVSEEIVKNELGQWVVVGVVRQHAVNKAPGSPAVPTVEFVAIEVVNVDDEEGVRNLLDSLRTARGESNVPRDLFNQGVKGVDDGEPIQPTLDEDSRPE